jgi:aspartyl-tRNA(Asn)/glutamyl-tRNA(Gln) amidotransferase subunit A
MSHALEVLKRMAASVNDVVLPGYGPLPLLGAEAYTFHERYVTKTPELYLQLTRQRIESGAAITAAKYIEARRELDRVRRAVAQVFTTVDVLVTPTTPNLPSMIRDADQPRATATPAGPLALRNTRPFDIYGLPTVSVPCGFSRSGLPIGLQISGPRLGEPVVLALAQAYEKATKLRSHPVV